MQAEQALYILWQAVISRPDLSFVDPTLHNAISIARDVIGSYDGRSPTPVDNLVAELETASYSRIFDTGSPMFTELMDRATHIFQTYPPSDQALALSCMFGMLIGEMEGHMVEADSQLGVIITLEDRIRIFIGTARAIAKAAIADKVMGDRPAGAGWRAVRVDRTKHYIRLHIGRLTLQWNLYPRG